MTAIKWVASVAALATLGSPSMANLPPVEPSPAMTLPITGEAPLLLDADGYVVSITELDEGR